MATLLSPEELLQVIVAHVPLAVWTTDKDGVFTFAASHAIELGQLNRDDYLGKGIEELFAPMPIILDAFRRALKGEKQRIVVDYGGLPFDTVYQPIKDAEGRIIGSTGVALDISERLKTLGELRQSEEITRRILEAVPAGIVLVSPAGEILDANGAGRQLLGLAYDQLLRRYVRDFEPETVWEDGSPCVVSDYPVSRCLMTREAQPPATIGTRRPDGSIAWCIFTAVPAVHPVTKGFIGAVVTFHDITHRKREEQERVILERQLAESQKLEAIGRLAGGLAHDLNNILSAILGHASLLKETFAPGTDEHDGASTIEIAGERAAKLTKQLLSFARHGKRQNDPVDLDAVVFESVELLNETLSKSIRITHRRASESAIVIGDASQLQQVLVNLAINAQDAMPQGGDLVFETSRGPEGRVTLVVRDTGFGMTPEVRERVFEPFYSTKESSTGMGLALVYGIVKSHGGTIDVQSSVGDGTVFEIRLPLAPVIPAKQVRPNTRKTHVLIVDDEAIVRDTAIALLERIGWGVLSASSGAEAVEMYRHKSDVVAVVLLDLVMPGMSGLECFRAMHALNPEIRCIVSSGYDRDGIASEILDTGLAGFLQKPYTLAKLRDALDRALT